MTEALLELQISEALLADMRTEQGFISPTGAKQSYAAKNMYEVPLLL